LIREAMEVPRKGIGTISIATQVSPPQDTISTLKLARVEVVEIVELF
jgi:hypothetical protein